MSGDDSIGADQPFPPPETDPPVKVLQVPSTGLVLHLAELEDQLNFWRGFACGLALTFCIVAVLAIVGREE